MELINRGLGNKLFGIWRNYFLEFDELVENLELFVFSKIELYFMSNGNVVKLL